MAFTVQLMQNEAVRVTDSEERAWCFHLMGDDGQDAKDVLPLLEVGKARPDNPRLEQEARAAAIEFYRRAGKKVNV